MFRHKVTGEEDFQDMPGYIERMIKAHEGVAKWDSLLQMEDRARLEPHRRVIGKLFNN